MEQDRIILHCDCNSFFASVEMAGNPALRNVPMAVGGSSEDRHGIILAKNELAKKYHVETAETLWSARKKCPDLVIVPPHYDEYVRYSHAVNRIYRRYTDQVEAFGIDESWLDVTGSERLFGDGLTIAERIRGEVKKEIGITVSVGVSFNKVFAKLGSDYKKPDAVTVISRDNYKKIMFPLPVENMLFVGKSTAEKLRSYNIRTIGELAESSRPFLVTRLGKLGGMIHDYANGRDMSPVASLSDEEEMPKSVGNGMTFRRDLVTADEIRVGLISLSEEVAARLRRHKLCAAGLSVTVKGADLKTVSRQKQLKNAADVGRILAEEAFSLVLQIWTVGVPVRSLTVTAMELIPADAASEQISFFDTTEAHTEKIGKIEKTVDEIRRRYGYFSMIPGAIMDNDIGIANKKEDKNKRKSMAEDKKEQG